MEDTPRSLETRRSRAATVIPAWWFLALYAALLLLVPTELVLPQLGSAGTPANLCGLGLLSWWVCAKLGGFLSDRPISPVHVALALLSVAVILSFAAGLASGWTTPVDIRQPTDPVWTLLPIPLTELHDKSVLAGFRGLIVIGSWIGVALVMADGVRHWWDLDRVMGWLTWLGAGVAAMGIYQYFTGDNLARFIQLPGLVANSEFGVSISRSVLNRVSATATHPIEFSVLLAVVLPIALHRALRHESDVQTGRPSIGAYLPVTLIALAVPMSVSRSGVLALAVALGIMFAGWPTHRRLVLLVLAPPAAILMRSALPGLLGTIRSLFTQALTDPSVTGRTEDFAVVTALYAEHPLLGRGPFTFIPQYYRVFDNQYLLNLVELGVIGLAASVATLVCGFYAARFCKRHGGTEEKRHFGLAISASIAALAVSYATFDAWAFSKAAGVSFLLLGAAAAAWRFSAEPKTAHRTRVPSGRSTAGPWRSSRSRPRGRPAHR